MAKPTFSGPSIQELDAIELADYGSLKKKSSGAANMPTGLRTPEEVYTPCHATEHTSKTPNELESSQPATPRQQTATGVFPSFFYPAMNRWRVLAACLTYFGNGMSDSAPGALIPYIEDWYHIGYAVVSLIW
jgi:hypothetical protein